MFANLDLEGIEPSSEKPLENHLRAYPSSYTEPAGWWADQLA